MGFVFVVLGAQWGDEGKGKIVDLLSGKAQIVARCQGGNNAGHTVVNNGKMYDFHIIPSGIVHPHCIALIGNGTVIHLPSLFVELKKNGITDMVGWEKRLKISSRAHLVFDFHQTVDRLRDSDSGGVRIGTTGRGIGPTYASKAWRNGLRIADLVDDFEIFKLKFNRIVALFKVQFPSIEVSIEEELVKYKVLREKLVSNDMVCESVAYLNAALGGPSDTMVLVEGANGTLLDIDFGSYPFVTSSNCSIGGVFTGLGFSPKYIRSVIGVVKAYQTRVGDGPFPTELNNETGTALREIGKEYGVTTGRPRRCGWLDLVLLKYSNAINGFTSLALTKMDVLDSFDSLSVAVAYELDGKVLDSPPVTVAQMERVKPIFKTMPGWKQSIGGLTDFNALPENAKAYVQLIESSVGVPGNFIFNSFIHFN